MNQRKTVLGLAAICALALSAFAVPSAFAAEEAYECSDEAAALDLSGAHCLEGATEDYGHVKITEPISIDLTNERTASGTTASAVSKLRGAVSGVLIEIQCETVGGSGELENSAGAATGYGTIEYGGCRVTQPAGKGCEVTGGTVTTKTLEGTTTGQAAGKLLFSPAGEGTEIATLPFKGCSIPALNNNFPVTGSLVAETSGATTTTTHAGVTTQNALKFGGVKAGIEGAITVTNSATANAITLTP